VNDEMLKTNIKVNPSLCSLCLSCQLICSLYHNGTCSPDKAKIVIEPNRISFSDDCMVSCHLCASYCNYGALTLN